MPSQSGSLRFRRTAAQMLCVAAIFAGLFAAYVRWEKQIDVANEARQQSFRLSSELRQTSNELTRMVRSYVATGDIRYKRYYLEILDIRNGVVGRPADYANGYWDLVITGELRPGPRAPAVSLQELMRRSGFTQAEFAKLAESKAYSDELTRTEFAAIALLESGGAASEAHRAAALRMLYDSRYHQAKSHIMLPIREFQRMMDVRTMEAVLLAERIAALVRLVFILVGVTLMVIQWRAYRTLYQQQELRNLAYQDALTELPNRRQFLDRLKHAVAASKRHGSHGAVLFLDLNKFKQLNDTHGHEVGDQLLVAVARRLQQATRETDTVARLGGDEFVVLLEDLGPDQARAADYAAQVGDKIHQALAGAYLLGAIRHQCSASIGISLFIGSQADPDDILKAADAAMYEKKRQSVS